MPEPVACDDAPATEPNAPFRGLVLVSTPIGNLGDMTGRGWAALAAADLVLCEDTRRAARLLNAGKIRTRTKALHEHNEAALVPSVLARLQAGEMIVLISDAGTPLLSDPGFRLTRAAIAAGIVVTALPGAHAAAMALTLSGLPPLPYLMLGFPPPRASARQSSFARLRAIEQAGLAATLIWYEAPHRLAATLADLAACFGPRPAAVARELTKFFEEVRRAPLPDLAAHYAASPARGEICIVVGPPASPEAPESEQIDALLRAALATSGLRDAAAAVAQATGLPRRDLYQRALTLRDPSG